MGRNRQTVNRARNRASMGAIGLVVVLLLGVLVIKGNAMKTQLAVYAAQEETLTAKIENEKKRTQEIDQLKEYMKTDDYVEEAAREKLGLVKDNEIVFEEAEETEE